VQTPLLGRFGVTDPSIQAIECADGCLQSSTEYHQKRLLCAGVGDNYTLGPVFRGSESGRLHNPEFTLLEWYRCGFDERKLMAEVAELVDQILGVADYQNRSANEMFTAVAQESESRLGVGTSDSPHSSALFSSQCMDEAYARLPMGRVFVVDFPAEQAMLAQLDPANPGLARRFELLVDRVEIANGYFELTDPNELRVRFDADNRARSAAGDAPQAIDTELLAAMMSGMPSCAGVALGVDRLLMLQLELTEIDQVQAFSWKRR